MSRAAQGGARRELVLVLLLGLAGAGLVLLAMRQGWAHVTTTAPRPFPSGTTTVTGEDLVPAADALAIAAIASLAAVLATRGLARRVTGAVLACLGAAVAVVAGAAISSADVLSAAAAGADPSTSSGIAAGSVTSGSSSGAGALPVTGFPAHATLAALPWRGAAIAGAIILVLAGVLVTWRAARLPVMSSRYERPAPAGQPRPGRPGRAADPAASMWDSLSRGEDPTAASPQQGRQGPSRS
jgi:uncharacterized membrane protein (TIGR02234 family)